MSTDTPAVQGIALTRTFSRVRAVNSVNITVPRGCIYGLIGLNGAGKSTLLRMIVGLLPPSSGQALLAGIDVWSNPVEVNRRLGYVPDRLNAYPWMRVREIIEFTRALRDRWDAGLVSRLLESGRIDPKQRVGKLSKGTAAKLSLLLALAHNPDILILDEPTDGMDPLARDEFMSQVAASAGLRTGDAPSECPPRTILLSSHAIDDIQRMCDHLGLMQSGSLALQTPTETLVGSTKRVRAIIESPEQPSVPTGALCSHRQGREWTLTLTGMQSDSPTRSRTLADIEEAGARVVEIADLSLDEIFKDIARGSIVRPTQAAKEMIA
jgi:ABC-2 type transport system ATP-binding protein